LREGKAALFRHHVCVYESRFETRRSGVSHPWRRIAQVGPLQSIRKARGVQPHKSPLQAFAS
jgi:hypothetical protein